jgi:hypothetical protein
MLVNPSCFEIHLAERVSAEPSGDDLAPWRDDAPSARCQPFLVTESDGLVGVRVLADGPRLARTSSIESGDFAVRVVRQRLSAYLALLAVRQGLLVNGVPVAGLTILTTGDSLVPAAGCLCHVTERVRPYVGPPVGDLLDKKCPFCRLPLTATTQVVVCRCGAPYHHETDQQPADRADEDRLRCFEKVRACLSCGRTVGIHEYLMWDPASL